MCEYTFFQILKKDVDSHRPCYNTVTKCVLSVIQTKSGSDMKPLLHTIDILGTTQENYFMIKMNPDMLSFTSTQPDHSRTEGVRGERIGELAKIL